MKPKTPWRSLLFLTAMIAVFSSCQKEYAPGEVIDPVVTDSTDTIHTGDSIYLDKIYGLEDVSGVTDTTYIMSFSYDAQKRLIAIKDSSLSGDENSIYQFFYNGTDTVPFKTTEAAYATPDSIFIESLKSYDAQNRLLKDSSRQFHLPDITTPTDILTTYFSYSAGSFTAQRTFESTTLTQVSYTKDTTLLDGSGNILSNKSWAVNGSSTYLAYASTFSYDANYAPLARWRWNFEQNLLTEQDHPTVQNVRNNRTSAATTYYNSSGTVTQQIDRHFTYQYNSRGLPLRMIWDEFGTNIFTYKAL